MRDRLSRSPEEDTGCHGRCEGDSKPGKIAQLRFGVLTADSYIAKFGKHGDNGDDYDRKGKNTGSPAKIFNDPVINIIDNSQKGFLVDKA